LWLSILAYNLDNPWRRIAMLPLPAASGWWQERKSNR
jgi:hypothetical protein